MTIVLHELAHGYTALWMGDQTAKLKGRLSLNPIHHIDPFGLVALYLFRFGWAKPVPVNYNNFRNRRMGIFLVSIAGVTMNFFLALLASFLLSFTWNNQPLIAEFLTYMLIYNISFGVFNLIPFPPLDGSKILLNLFPFKEQEKIYRYERYFYIILLISIFTGALSRFSGPIVYNLVNKFYFLFN